MKTEEQISNEIKKLENKIKILKEESITNKLITCSFFPILPLRNTVNEIKIKNRISELQTIQIASRLTYKKIPTYNKQIEKLQEMKINSIVIKELKSILNETS